MNLLNYTPKISVIVPVYNVEKYIKRCLETIQKQTFTDFEVLVINDGTKDNSAVIAQQFCEEDKRFFLYHKENGGLSDARNYGFARAKGEYIIFIDSDDYIGKDCLMKMYNAAKTSDADVTVCNYAINFEPECRVKKKPLRNLKAGEFSRDEALSLLLRDERLRFYIWNKLWKKEFLDKTGIKFINIIYEDIVFCSQNFVHINKLCSIDYIGNFYSRQTKTILEVSMSFKRLNDYISTVKYLRECLEENGLFEKFKKSFRVHALHVYFSVPMLVIQANHSAEKKEKLFSTIIKDMKLVSYYMGKNFKLEKKA